MAAEITDRVHRIADARGLPESEVLEKSLERGLEELWEDVVLSRYFDGNLDRDEVASLTRALQRKTSLFVTDTVGGARHRDAGR